MSVYNRSADKTEEFFLKSEAEGKNFVGTYSIEEFVNSLEKNHVKILLMVKAGGPTDATIESLKPYLEKKMIFSLMVETRYL
ncbi:hypothetical protein GCM10020331_084230 [Ectobacillus funiculus]